MSLVAINQAVGSHGRLYRCRGRVIGPSNALYKAVDALIRAVDAKGASHNAVDVINEAPNLLWTLLETVYRSADAIILV